jgi:predicted nuclease of predicted toxin-antitoxin system
MSALRLKLDENMHTDLVPVLRKAGHDVEHACDEGLSGCTDPAVIEAATSEQRVLVTLDLDFSNLHAYRPGRYAGILVLRPRSQGYQSVLRVLMQALTRLGPEEFQGGLVVAEHHRIRVRRDLGGTN